MKEKADELLLLLDASSSLLSYPAAYEVRNRLIKGWEKKNAENFSVILPYLFKSVRFGNRTLDVHKYLMEKTFKYPESMPEVSRVLFSQFEKNTDNFAHLDPPFFFHVLAHADISASTMGERKTANLLNISSSPDFRTSIKASDIRKNEKFFRHAFATLDVGDFYFHSLLESDETEPSLRRAVVQSLEPQDAKGMETFFAFSSFFGENKTSKAEGLKAFLNKAHVDERIFEGIAPYIDLAFPCQESLVETTVKYDALVKNRRLVDFVDMRWDNVVKLISTSYPEDLAGFVAVLEEKDKKALLSEAMAVSIFGLDLELTHRAGFYLHPTSKPTPFIYLRSVSQLFQKLKNAGLDINIPCAPSAYNLMLAKNSWAGLSLTKNISSELKKFERSVPPQLIGLLAAHMGQPLENEAPFRIKALSRLEKRYHCTTLPERKEKLHQLEAYAQNLRFKKKLKVDSKTFSASTARKM